MAGNYDRPRLLLKVEGLYRLFFKEYFCDKTQSIEVNEYPKSGGSWLGEMLADATGLAFPRNKFPTQRVSLFHGHSLRRSPIIKTVVLWRDPRDVMISWYHHCVIGNSHVNPAVVKAVRLRLGFKDVHDVSANLTEFISASFQSPDSPRFTLSDFYDAWAGRSDVLHVRYEDLKEAPVETMDKLLRGLGVECSAERLLDVVDKHSFARVSKRSEGVEDKSSFVRKGVVGDWVNYFDDSSLGVLRGFLDSRAEQLGYKI